MKAVEPISAAARDDPTTDAFALLLDIAEDIAIAQRVRERGATDTGHRVSLAQFADELGVDLNAI